MLEQDRKDLERRIAEMQRKKAAERAGADRTVRNVASGQNTRKRTDSARTIRPDAKTYSQRPEKQLVAPPSYYREDSSSGERKRRPGESGKAGSRGPKDGQRAGSGQRPRDGQRAGNSQRPRDGQRAGNSQRLREGQRPRTEETTRDGRRQAGPRPETSRKKSLEAARRRKHRKQIWMMQRIGVILGLILALILFFWMITLIGKGIGRSIAEKRKAKETAASATEEQVTEAATEVATEGDAAAAGADSKYPTFEEPAEYSSTAMREKGVPEDLIEFYEKYPEVAPYAWFFPEKSVIDYDMDISKEVTKGTIPYFCQWDDRWGYKEFGSSYMGVNGCGPTCITMVYSGLTGKTDYTPYDMALYVRDRGYYVPGSGTVWATMEAIPPELGLTVENVQFDAEGIRSKLREGHPIICNVGPGDFTKVGHYILLAGVDDDGNIIVHDPNSPKRTAKHWDVDVLIAQIRNLWSYSYQE